MRDSGVWPLGGDVRFRLIPDGRTILETLRMHQSIIDLKPPNDPKAETVASVHTHVGEDCKPEDTDVLAVLAQPQKLPMVIVCPEHTYQIALHGHITVIDMPKLPH
jgi:hypothetical protein